MTPEEVELAPEVTARSITSSGRWRRSWPWIMIVGHDGTGRNSRENQQNGGKKRY
jgi:hypothetical protein